MLSRFAKSSRVTAFQRDGVLIERRRAGVGRILPSVGIGRLCLLLLVAPWILLLALKAVFAANGLSSSMFFFVLFSELGSVTFASMAVVSKRVQELRQYEAGREHERLLFSHARDGMLLVRVTYNPNRTNGSFRFTIQAENPAAVERLSSIGQAESYVGLSIQEAFPAWLWRQLDKEYTTCVLSGQGHRYEVNYPDGRMAHESKATPVIDRSTARVTHVIVVMRDIGERLAHQQQMASALQRAEAANKSKSEFLASMSHELRTPLNAIIGFSDMLTAGIPGTLNEKQAEYVGHIHRSGSHLLSIISDILDLSKIEAGRFSLQIEDILLADLVANCLLLVQQRAEDKGISLKTTIAEGIPTLRGDPLRLKQILINLLSNAIKFTDVGSVMLDVRFGPGAFFVFTVTDTGIGMTKDEAKIALQRDWAYPSPIVSPYCTVERLK
jgi:signal transduction histidine kinase